MFNSLLPTSASQNAARAPPNLLTSEDRWLHPSLNHLYYQLHFFPPCHTSLRMHLLPYFSNVPLQASIPIYPRDLTIFSTLHTCPFIFYCCGWDWGFWGLLITTQPKHGQSFPDTFLDTNGATRNPYDQLLINHARVEKCILPLYVKCATDVDISELRPCCGNFVLQMKNESDLNAKCKLKHTPARVCPTSNCHSTWLHVCSSKGSATPTEQAAIKQMISCSRVP